MGEFDAYRMRSGGVRDPDGIANAIIATRKYPGNELRSFLIVEGDTDRRFYARFIDKAKCQITHAFNKSAALQVHAILEKEQFPGFLLLLDADFDTLDGKVLLGPNVVFTDAHDLETMIIRSPALEKVLAEIGSEEKIAQITQQTSLDVRTILLNCGMPMGYLRWVSLQKTLSLKFEDLDFTHFVEQQSFTINVPKFISEVKNKSQRQELQVEVLMSSMQEIRSEAHDPWQVCCGHDLVHILAVGLRKTIGTHNAQDIKPDMLETSLRLAFESAYFSQTQLYAAIQLWENTNKPYIIIVR